MTAEDHVTPERVKELFDLRCQHRSSHKETNSEKNFEKTRTESDDQKCYQDIDVAVEDGVEGEELAAAVVRGVDPGHEVVLEHPRAVATCHDG